MPIPDIVRPFVNEPENVTVSRIEEIYNAWHDSSVVLSDANESIVKELFGRIYLTDHHHLTELDKFVR